MSNELTEHLLSFIQTAVDLAESVKSDAEKHGVVSSATIDLLGEFNKKHNDLGDILDVVNGVM